MPVQTWEKHNKDINLMHRPRQEKLDGIGLGLRGLEEIQIGFQQLEYMEEEMLFQ